MVSYLYSIILSITLRPMINKSVLMANKSVLKLVSLYNLKFTLINIDYFDD